MFTGFYSKICAVIRGLFIHLVSLLSKKVDIGKKFICFGDVKIIARHKGKISIGKEVTVLQHSTISSVYNGKCIICDGVGLGENNIIKCQEKVYIGENTLFGPGVKIFDQDHLMKKNLGVKRKEFKTAPVVIGKNCWVGANAVILRGSIIGDNCIIAAGSIVKGCVPSNTTYIQKKYEYLAKNGGGVLSEALKYFGSMQNHITLYISEFIHKQLIAKNIDCLKICNYRLLMPLKSEVLI